MSSDQRCMLRDPTAADLHRGGRRLLHLIDGMSGHTLRGCRLEVLDDRPDVVTIHANGLEVVEWGWPTMDVLGAVLFLRNLNLAPEGRSVEPGLGEMSFVITADWGLLPPAVPALRCDCAVLPGAEIRASLHVLSEEEAQAGMRAAAQSGRMMTWRIP